MATELKLKRAYDPPAASDGQRILVDRVWPRGVRKADLALAAWIKEVAPSTGLRRWFDHDPAKWEAFRERYFRELDGQPSIVARLREHCSRGTVTLVFAARDVRFNNAVALKEYLENDPGGTAANGTVSRR